MTHSVADQASSEEEPQPTAGEQRQAVVRLLVVVAVGVVAAVATGFSLVLLVVLAFVAMVMLHELGHFLVAKWAGMKVTQFFLGFGPRLWSVRKGETEYGIKAIPLGGYVKIPGMTNMEKVDPADEARAYRQQPYGRRLAVVLAGSAMHFVIALVVLYVVYTLVGVPNETKELPRVGTISRLASGEPSPAQRAGFQAGDRLISYDGVPFRGFEGMRQHIRRRAGQPIRFVVERDGRRLELTATPVDLSKESVGREQERPSEPTGFVGIGPDYAVEREGPLEGLAKSVSGVGEASVLTVKALVDVFSPSGASAYGRQLTGRAPADPGGEEPRFLSIWGFLRLGTQAANAGWLEALTLLALINVFVGIFNLTPLLPFDGGHVAIATYERLRSRRGRRHHADVARAMPVFYMVFALLVFIAVSSLYLDIVRPLENPFQ